MCEWMNELCCVSTLWNTAQEYQGAHQQVHTAACVKVKGMALSGRNLSKQSHPVGFTGTVFWNGGGTEEDGKAPGLASKGARQEAFQDHGRCSYVNL